MNVLKPLVLEGRIPRAGVLLAQPALRTMNLKEAHCADYRPQWPSYFLQLGAVAPMTARYSAAEAALAFLDQQLPNEPERVVLQASVEDRDLVALHPANRTVELYAGDKTRYRHRYGVPGLVGRTLNYTIRDPGGTSHAVGNFIVLEMAERPVAVELAFGPSNLLARIDGLELPIQATNSAVAVPLRSWAHVRLADTLSGALVLLREGLRPVGSGRHRVTRTYLQTLSRLRRAVDMPIDELTACAVRFQRTEFGAVDDLPGRVTRYVVTYEELQADSTLESPRRNALAALSFGSLALDRYGNAELVGAESPAIRHGRRGKGEQLCAPPCEQCIQHGYAGRFDPRPWGEEGKPSTGPEHPQSQLLNECREVAVVLPFRRQRIVHYGVEGISGQPGGLPGLQVESRLQAKRHDDPLPRVVDDIPQRFHDGIGMYRKRRKLLGEYAEPQADLQHIRTGSTVGDPPGVFAH